MDLPEVGAIGDEVCEAWESSVTFGHGHLRPGFITGFASSREIPGFFSRHFPDWQIAV